MLSFDTNILLHAYNRASPSHRAAFEWLGSIQHLEDVAVSEFVLAEFYGLLRNHAVIERPLSAGEAVGVVQTWRSHPRWRLLGFPSGSRDLHESLWRMAAMPGFAFRRIYDVRTALTLVAQGVTEFATANESDLHGLGFARVWNPIASQG